MTTTAVDRCRPPGDGADSAPCRRRRSGPAPGTAPHPGPVPPAAIVIAASDGVPEEVARRARDKLAALVERQAGPQAEPVVFAGLRLTSPPDGRSGRFGAQTVVNLTERRIRLQTAAADPTAAVDLLMDRLRDELRRTASPDGGTHPRPRPANGTPPDDRHRSDDRLVVEHEPYAAARETVADAVQELRTADRPFVLFVDAETGADGLVYRTAGDECLVAEVSPDTRPHIVTGTSVTMCGNPAPRLTVEQAQQMVELCDVPFVFFADADTARGCVLHRRRDGGYGLVTAAVPAT